MIEDLPKLFCPTCGKKVIGTYKTKKGFLGFWGEEIEKKSNVKIKYDEINGNELRRELWSCEKGGIYHGMFVFRFCNGEFEGWERINWIEQL